MNWTDKEEVRRYYREYRQANREKALLQQKRWRENNVEKTLLASARKRSKAKGIPITISLEDIKIPLRCPVLGVELKINQEGGRQHSRTSPTLDRIDPALGYTQGNVQVISYLANVMKNDATPEELLMFADWVYKTYGN